MASLYPNITTEGYDHLGNDTMNDSNNSTTNSSFSVSRDCDMLHFIVYTVVGAPILVVGFFANIICYNVLKRNTGVKHSAATFLLQALAVADNLVLTFSLGFIIIFGLLPVLGTREKIVSAVMAQHYIVYVWPLLSMAVTMTVWITVLIAINRYIAVCWPLEAHRLANLWKTKIQVALVFISAIIFNLPVFFRYTIRYDGHDDFISWPHVTEASFGPNTTLGKVYAICFIALGVLILPLILLIIFNSRIIWELRKVDKWKDTIRQNSSRSEKDITMVMLAIVIVFIVCNVPRGISLMLEKFMQDPTSCSGHHAFKCVSELLVATNCCTNFLVYYVLRKSFRNAFRQALCCSKPQALVV